MQFAKFKYTDSKQKVTDRTVLVVSKPSDKLNAIDLSELNEFDQAEFGAAYRKRYDAFLAEIEVLKEAYDLKHNFRQFIPDRMENVSFEQA